MTRKNTVAKVGKCVVSFADDGEPQLLGEAAPASPSQARPRARAPPDPEALLTGSEAAALLRCSVHSLNKWRLTGNGPAFVYVGRRVRYTRAALADFIASSTRNSTSDPGSKGAATAA